MSGWVDNGNGTSTFVTSYGPITIPTPRLDNSLWGDDLSDITTQSDGYHEYRVETTLGYSTDDVSLLQVQEAFAEYPTPFGSYFAGPGFVSHYSPDDSTIINITRQFHALDPGIVFRQIVIEDGQYKIITYGMGTGIAPGLNEDLAPLAWGLADARISQEIIEQGMESGNLVLPEGFSTTAPDSCFGPAVPIDMWPLDPAFAPDPNNPYKQYDQDAVRAKIWKKPISEIEVGDWVVSHDKNGNMVPGYVPRTMTNDSKILLDFHGTAVTPGHVYYRPDSKLADKYETLIDVLRDDGMIEDCDGVKLRAATYAPVGGLLDGFVQAVTGIRKADGTLDGYKDQGRIRLGTRFLIGTGKTRKSFTVADLIKAGGGVVGEDELIRVGDGPAMPFHWEFGDMLPKPEDFVLACSGTTLEEIYKVAEWESQGPRLPAPMVLDRGPVQPLTGAALSAMPRNEPLDVAHISYTSDKPDGSLQHTPN